MKKIKLKVGDLVTSTYGSGDSSDVVRKITNIEQDSSYGSGYKASADGGEQCKCCGRIPSRPITDVDAAWFELTSDKSN